MEDMRCAERLQTVRRHELCYARDAVNAGFLGIGVYTLHGRGRLRREFHGLAGNGAWSPSVALTVCKRLSGVNFAMHEMR